jgi:cell division protein FtsW
MWIAVGTFAGVVTYFIGYKRIIKLLPILLPAGIIALVAILIFGNEINGAKRWFNVAGIAIQPAEFIKPIIILYLSALLAKDDEQTKKGTPWQKFLNKLLKFGPPVGIIFILVALEPDFGTALVIISTSLVLFFVSLRTFDDIKFFFGGFSVLAVLGGGVLVLEPYRIERIKTFFSLLLTGEVNDPRGTGYQMQQILIGIGSGGFLGKGFGQSRQRFGYLVENTAFTDSIFAVVLEEFGVLSGLILIGSWIFFLVRGFKIADAVQDKTGKYLAIV